jgi:hypothetical protein
MCILILLYTYNVLSMVIVCITIRYGGDGTPIRGCLKNQGLLFSILAGYPDGVKIRKGN